MGLILSFQIAQSCETYPIFNGEIEHFPLQKTPIQNIIFNPQYSIIIGEMILGCIAKLVKKASAVEEKKNYISNLVFY